MKFLFLLILPLIDATLPPVVPEKESPYYVEVRKYEQCKELPETQIMFRNLKIDRVGKDNYTLSGDVDVTEDLPGPLYMGAKVQKCKDHPDSCDHVMDQVMQDLCQDLKNKNSAGYKVFHNYLNFKDPGCPIKKGYHRMESKQFDSAKIQYLAGVAKFWKANMYFYASDKKTATSCVYFELAVKEKTRKREWFKKSQTNP